MSTGEVNTTYKRKVKVIVKVAERKHKNTTALFVFLGDISPNIEHPHSLTAVFSSPSNFKESVRSEISYHPFNHFFHSSVETFLKLS